MRQLLELSSLRLLTSFLFILVNSAFVRAETVQKEIPDFSFLEQAEDIEREAWWVITTQRIEGSSSPFRVFRAAAAKLQKNQKSQVRLKFCQSLGVLKQNENQWRIESYCQKPAIEIGVVQKENFQKWKVTWKTSPFSDHFGMSTSILYHQQFCEIEMDKKGRISRMSCPDYVRDRKMHEIVQFSVFEYQVGSSQIMKLEGHVKKELQVISTFKTEVPLVGDIILKVKKVSQKLVEEKSELSNMTPIDPITRGDSDGKKTSPQNPEKEKHQESFNGPDRQEIRDQENVNDSNTHSIDEVPPIEDATEVPTATPSR